MGMLFKNKYQSDSRLPLMDRFLNLVGGVALIAGGLALLAAYDAGLPGIALRDSAVIAFHKHDIMSFLAVLPFCWLLLGGFILLAERDPLFEKRERSAPRDKSDRLRTLKVVFFAVILPALLLSLTVFGRDTLTVSQELERYNALNVRSRVVQVSDCREMELFTRNTGGARRPSNWVYGVRFTAANGSVYTFHTENFDTETYTDGELLEYLLALKDLFPAERLVVNGADRLEDVLRDQKLSEAETALLYELFSSPGG